MIGWDERPRTRADALAALRRWVASAQPREGRRVSVYGVHWATIWRDHHAPQQLEVDCALATGTAATYADAAEALAHAEALAEGRPA